MHSREQLDTLVDRIIRRIRVRRTCEGFTDSQIYRVLDEASKILSRSPAMIEIEAPVVIFGDTHGQLADLLRFCKIVGEPPDTQWLFLGDYVDRCKKGFEIVLYLLCMKIKFPDRVHVLRGNHECMKTNRIYGFFAEMNLKRSTAMWVRINQLFNDLPVCAAIGRKFLCMHGGISEKIDSWKALTDMQKPRSQNECDDGIAVDLMWADPANDCCAYNFNNNRGTSVLFGSIALNQFCKRLNLDMIVRAHEAMPEGHQLLHDNRLCTVFSAPNYCGIDGNCASVMRVSPFYEFNFVTLKPKMDSPKLTPEVVQQLQKYTDAKSPSLQPNPRRVE